VHYKEDKVPGFLMDEIIKKAVSKNQFGKILKQPLIYN